MRCPHCGCEMRLWQAVPGLSPDWHFVIYGDFECQNCGVLHTEVWTVDEYVLWKEGDDFANSLNP